MKQTVCDICGKPIGTAGRYFKVKECRGLFGGYWWEEIDCHDECVRAIVKAKEALEKEVHENETD